MDSRIPLLETRPEGVTDDQVLYVADAESDRFVLGANTKYVELGIPQSDVLSMRQDGMNLILTLKNGNVIVLDGYFRTEGMLPPLDFAETGMRPLAGLLGNLGLGALKGGDSPAAAAPPEPLTLALSMSPEGYLVVTGAATRHASVTVTFPDGSTKTVQADDTGLYSVTSDAIQPSGDVSAVAIDENGKSSRTGNAFLRIPTTIDAGPGNDDGTLTVTGTSGPFDTVTVTFPSGERVSVQADNTGRYAATSTGVETTGVVSATSVSPNGNPTDVVRDNFVDTTGPAAPIVVAGSGNADGTLTVTGLAEPNADVTVIMPSGQIITVTAGPDGTFELVSSGPEPEGDVTATQIDAAGNGPGPAGVDSFVDSTGPSVTIDAVGSDDAGFVTVSGVASEPGSSVTVTFPNGTTRAVASDPVTGAYSATSATGGQPDAAPDEMRAVATDPNGVTGAPAVADYTDSTGPSVTIDTVSSDDAGFVTVSGVASEPGSSVTVTFPDGTMRAVASDPVTGAYSATSATGGQPDAAPDEVRAVATDPNGVTGAPAVADYSDSTGPSVTIDAVGSDDAGFVTVSGVASEPGSSVTVTFPDGTTRAVASDPVTGAYSATSATGGQPDAAPDEVRAVATDPNGVTGAPAVADYVDTTPPPAPTIDASIRDQANMVTGTGQPGNTVTVTSGAATVGTVSVLPDGTWSMVAPTPVADGATLSAVQTDPNGVASTPPVTQVTFTDTDGDGAANATAVTADNDGDGLSNGDEATVLTTSQLSDFQSSAAGSGVITAADGTNWALDTGNVFTETTGGLNAIRFAQDNLTQVLSRPLTNVGDPTEITAQPLVINLGLGADPALNGAGGLNASRTDATFQVRIDGVVYATFTTGLISSDATGTPTGTVAATNGASIAGPANLRVNTVDTFELTLPAGVTFAPGARIELVFTAGSNGNNMIVDTVRVEPADIPAPDFDADGIDNALDIDSDNDGIWDAFEPGNTDINTTNGDLAPDSLDVDSDADGISDRAEVDLDQSGADAVTGSVNISPFIILEDNVSLDLTGTTGGALVYVDMEDGAGGETVTLSDADLFNSASGDMLIISGDAGDTVNATDFVATDNQQSIEGQVYDVYLGLNDSSVLLVDEDVTVNILLS